MARHGALAVTPGVFAYSLTQPSFGADHPSVGMTLPMTVAQNPDSWSRFYVPEIHDLYPGSADRLDMLLGALPDKARERAALLLVPYWQQQHRLDSAGGFCRTLRDFPGDVVLHGWTHSLGFAWWDWLWCGHDNRSEFAGLSEREATRRLMLGRSAFADAIGRVPRWFCAPRWQQNRAVTAALKATGFVGFHLHNRVELCSGERISLPALCFDEGERSLGIAIGRTLRTRNISTLLRQGRPFRLTLHPTDMCYAKTWRQLTGLIARLDAEGWAPLSLDEALDRWRRTNIALT